MAMNSLWKHLFDRSDRKDLAVGRPTTQSSFHPQPQRDDALRDAPSASPALACHTTVELNPWWKINLEAPCKINGLKIYDQFITKGKWDYFTILFSIDDKNWIDVFSNSGRSMPKKISRDSVNLEFKSAHYAQYIMIRRDGHNYLQFGKFSAFGTTVHKIPKPTNQNVSENSISIANIDGVEIQVHNKLYSDQLKRPLHSGEYEKRERALLKKTVMPGDRVLEVGSATGLISMLAAKIVGDSNIITFEGNPRMVTHAKENFLRNNHGGIQIKNAILKNATRWKGPNEALNFYISRNFWASSLTLRADTVEIVSVPTLCLEDIIRDSNSNVLICDIEGGEVDLLMDADLSRIDTIMLETHYVFAGEQPINRLIKRLINRGFSIDLTSSGANVVLMYRGFALKKIPSTLE